MARARRRREERDSDAALLFVTLPPLRRDWACAAPAAFALRLDRPLTRAERPRLDFAPFPEADFDTADFLPDPFLEAVRRCLA